MMKRDTTFDKLQKERARLVIECQEKEEKLMEDFRFLNENSSALFADAILTAAQSKFSNLLSSSCTTSIQPTTNSIATGDIFTSLLSFVKENITPKLVLRIARPLITAFLAKKVKNLFLKSK